MGAGGVLARLAAGAALEADAGEVEAEVALVADGRAADAAGPGLDVAEVETCVAAAGPQAVTIALTATSAGTLRTNSRRVISDRG
ncbi:MAG TPA: hypothetical protein VMW62_13590 [Chloroflexota bacterium]|nr:hypothetical protein [Chloroflexota bacterium]